MMEKTSIRAAAMVMAFVMFLSSVSLVNGGDAVMAATYLGASVLTIWVVLLSL